MVGKKQRHLLAIPRNKNINPSGHVNSSKSSDDLDVQGEDSWVIVKKQRVTILVPPLPAAKNLKTRNLGPSQLEARPQKTSNQIQPPIDICPRILSINQEGKSMSLAPEKSIQFVRKAPSQDLPTLAKPPREDLRIEAENTNQVGTSKTCERFGVSDTSKAIKRPRLLHCPSGLIDGARGGMLLSQKLRASNLEIKLKRAGGLSRWLASLGLDQFVRIFQRKSVNKFQLVNLTMKKLKDMGADAVGPRRKLIHAIDCVCQSYCFEAI